MIIGEEGWDTCHVTGAEVEYAAAMLSYEKNWFVFSGGGTRLEE